MVFGRGASSVGLLKGLCRFGVSVIRVVDQDAPTQRGVYGPKVRVFRVFRG